MRSVVVVVTILLSLLPATFRAADGGGNEDTARGMIQAFTGGDAAAAFMYMKEHAAPDLWGRRGDKGWTMIAGMLSKDLAGGEIVGVDVAGPSKILADVETAKGIASFDLDFDDEGRIAGFNVGMNPVGHAADDRPAFPGPGLRPGMSRADLTEALGSYFAGLAADDKFSGTALVALDGTPVFSAAHGLASRRFAVPNTMATRFDIGSINKDFTKIAIANLCAAGKLRLEDTIATHLPDYPDADVAAKVTIDQLVHHRTGIPDIFNEDFFRSALGQFRTPRDYFPLFAGKPLEFEPDSSMQYSNANYIILGAIIEAVTEQSYDDWVVEHVFRPAGMVRCGFFANDEPVADVAEGYTRNSPYAEGELRSNVLMMPAKGSPAGSAMCTAADLLRFDDALRNHRLTSPGWTLWVFDGPAPESGTAGDGPSERLEIGAALAGGAPGVSAVIEIEGPLVVIVLANLDTPIAEDIAEALMQDLRAVLK